jgi:hypothetical protein
MLSRTSPSKSLSYGLDILGSRCPETRSSVSGANFLFVFSVRVRFNSVR